MDLNTISQELNKRFTSPLPEFYKRRIVVWYDEDQEFADQIDGLQIPDVQVVKLTGTNYFKVKKLIAVDEPQQNFLIYKPYGDPNPEHDWLMDVELYSEEFRADLIAIWMNEMGMHSSVSLRNEMKRYSKFLQAKNRRENVVKIADRLDSPMQLQLAVLASIVGASKADPILIIRSVLRAGLNENGNDPYQELIKYDAADLFWSMVARITGYTDAERDLGALASQILLTAGSRTLPENAFEGLERHIAVYSQQAAMCAELVTEWIHSDDISSYEPIAESVQEEMHLVRRFMQQEVDMLADTDAFPCIDEIILTRLMTDIGNEIINPDLIDKALEKRRTSVWFAKYEDYYDGIFALARMQDFYKEHAAGFHLVGAEKIWNAYTNDYYKMDTWYRSFYMSYERSKKSYGGSLQDLFTGVSEKVERLYVNWYLGGLGANWSDQAAGDLASRGYMEGIPRQEDFYGRKVRNADSKIYVIISDAMRYEVAASLSEKLAQDMHGKVDLSSMQGVFPTITKFGMAALLPHQKMSVEYTNDHLNVLDDGQPTDSTYRGKILQEANKESITFKAKELLSMKRAERSALVKGKDVVYIYHDTIDEAGHASEEKVFSACEEAIGEIENLVKTIVNDFGGINLYITSDHGFLYTYSPLTEEDKADKSDFKNRIIEYGRRFAILRKGKDPDYLLPVKLLDGNTDYEGYAPRESIRLKASAGHGMNFVHGGVSLQEMCVPLVSYKHLRNQSKEYLRNKDKYDTKPVGVNLLSANHKVTNMAFALNFYQKDAVGGNREAANYDVYFVDATGQKVSDVQRIIADKHSANAQERAFRCTFNLKSQAYDSKENYYLVIERVNGTGLPERVPFTIDIAFAVDGFDFF